MITLDEVLALRDAIPPRFEHGDVRNFARCRPASRFGLAAKQFKKEQGISFLEAMKARDVR